MKATATRPDLAATVAAPAAAAAQADPARYAMAVTRLSLGFVFLWAFADKTFGLGFATAPAQAWISGGSPTYGFLNVGTEGKLFHDFFSGLGGPAADVTFMAGLLGIGVAMSLGIGMRIAAVAGAVLMVLMWAALLPLETNPFIDYHLVYAMTLIALALDGAGRTWGLGRAWERLALVQRFRFLA